MAGLTWDDIGSQRFPVDQFIPFVMHAPPNSAVYHEKSEGWTVTDHLLAQAIDALNRLAWFKTADAQSKNPRHRPEPVPRPGMKPAKSKPASKGMTMAEYAKKAGLKIQFDETEVI